MANCERNKRLLLELVKQPDNSRCADCGATDPEWASYKLGVFVCLNCSGVHRSLSSQVKSIKLDFWEDKLIEFMKSKGNASARAVYEKAVPVYYYRPKPNDSVVLREQWIRAKYERMEFTGETKYPPVAYTTGDVFTVFQTHVSCRTLKFFNYVGVNKYVNVGTCTHSELCKKKMALCTMREPGSENWTDCQSGVHTLLKHLVRPDFLAGSLGLMPGFYEGMLWKKGKENTQFLKRKFVLSDREFTLTYYNKEDESKGPKAVIAIKDLNATFQPEKIGHPYSLQITYQEEDHTRNLYVYHESAEEIVTWYNAIRAARYAYLKTAYPTGSDEELIPMITRNYLKEGYMEKTGPLQKEPFKKRWFILDSQNRKLLYFKGQLDAEELGAIFIGTESNGYSVRECVPKNARGNKWTCGVMLVTPERQFVFMCEQEREQKEWLGALKQILFRPMAPQDYTSKQFIF
ncbi:Arf-GAP with dual PH domain-containing protein 2 Centaurin-alpha-2 [Channa argus]|uniref:Arf-GAP with dual PH domain-containing protein 2 Centaurin-alpha-2 n=1 Tax=Channa argus TaxID=215402 RepID=A0A6G1QC97_CHAAH|nr:Arf-GAP with dual PH domain-containing protein 2 Centaurin-alpha-2 [Channa argus]